MVVIDIDNEDSFQHLLAKYGPLPDTVEQHTGRGRQLFFRYPEHKEIHNKTELDGALGIDVRGKRGYVVVPPSKHLTGKCYTWKISGDPTDGAQLAELPPAWLTLLTRSANPHSPMQDQGETCVFREGRRNDGLFRRASSMRAKGLSSGAIEAALLEENRNRCNPPLSECEVHSIAQSVGRYPQGEGDAAPMSGAWPDPPDTRVYHGLAGQVVNAIEPHTESDPVALLVQFLVAFGNIIGRGPHFVVEAATHYTNPFTILVGRTSKGRKGTAWGHIHNLFRGLDSKWAENRVLSGLSSGEGLIWQVRDPITKQQPVFKGRGKSRRIAEYEDVMDDSGEHDKRCLIIEAEFASPLKVMGREGNTLSPLIRQAWDTGTLRTLTKNSPARATGTHISIIGHVTCDELRRRIAKTELCNGFANRFLWLCVRRSKCLPEGSELLALDVLQRRMDESVIFAKNTRRMERDPYSKALWAEVYPRLSEGKPGLLGAATSRAEAITLRLSCLYALLDHSAIARAEHLQAALALWTYAEHSARYIFGSALGDPVADEILAALKAQTNVMTRTELREHFARHKKSNDIGRALCVLAEDGRVRMVEEESGGRPIERWFTLHQ